MSHIDTNLLRDITTQKTAVPTEDSLKFEFRAADIKIIRLKSSEDWLRYVAMKAHEPDWHKK